MSKDPKTGQLFGMTPDLITKNAHIGGTALFITADRVDHVDYISMPYKTKIRFLYRAPPLSYTSNIYYLPLSYPVWMCTVSLVIVSIGIIYITFKYSVQDRAVEDEIRLNRTLYFVLAAIAAVCQMSNQLRPKRMSERISTVSVLEILG